MFFSAGPALPPAQGFFWNDAFPMLFTDLLRSFMSVAAKAKVTDKISKCGFGFRPRDRRDRRDTRPASVTSVTSVTPLPAVFIFAP